MSLTYSFVSGTTWVNGMTASATNLNNAVNSASISFQNSGTLVGRVSSGAGTMEDVPMSTFLQAANNLSDIGSASTSRTNLGLGTAATHAATDFLLAASNLSDVANAGTSRTNLGLGTAATHAATDFLLAASNLSDVANAGTSRTNLGLGSGNSPTFTGLTLSGGLAGVTTLAAVSGTFASTTSTAAVSASNSAATGSSNGIDIAAGANGSDYSLRARNKAGSTIMIIRGDSSIAVTGAGSNSAVSVTTSSASYGLTVQSQNVAGNSNGISIAAGTNSSDNCFLYQSAAPGTLGMIRGDGAWIHYNLATIGGSSAPDAALMVPGVVHITDTANAPSSTKGLELAYIPGSNAAVVNSVNRAGSAGTEMRIFGNPVKLFYNAASGSPVAAVTVSNASATGVQFNGYGAGTLSTDASGNISASSDLRLKTDVKLFERGIIPLRHIQPISYRWKRKSGMETKGRYFGFSAQNVQKFLPEAVSRDRKGLLSINDRALIAALVNAVKTLSDRVSALEE